MDEAPGQSNTAGALHDWLDRAPSMLHAAAAPEWMGPVIAALRRAEPHQLSINDPLADRVAPRQAAVLVLIGGSTLSESTVVLVRRARDLRDHGGEIGFPGGAWEPGDVSPVDTALREAAEEIGVDPAGIDPLLVLPRLVIRASGFDVTAVVSHWRQPGPIGPVDPRETDQVLTISLPEIADSGKWSTMTVPGWSGPSVAIDDATLVWGYTAELLSFLCRHL